MMGLSVIKSEDISDSGIIRTQIIEDPCPSIARVIISYELSGTAQEAKDTLEEVCRSWPKGKKVNFIITCGGFLEFDCPDTVRKEKIGNVLSPNDDVINAIIDEGKKSVRVLFDGGLWDRLVNITDYITIGADSYLCSGEYIDYSIELVYVVDLKKNTIYATGKTYPTPSQQKFLLRITNLESHFLKLNGENVMVLGCHDLNMFSNRSLHNAKGWRKDTINEIRKLAHDSKPILVLQHPHNTDSIRIWSTALGGLKEELPGIKFASAGKYYYQGAEQRSALDDVLKKTKNIDTIDFIFDIVDN